MRRILSFRPEIVFNLLLIRSDHFHKLCDPLGVQRFCYVTWGTHSPDNYLLKQQILSLQCLCSFTLHFQKSMLNINLCLFDPDSQKRYQTGERILHGVRGTQIPKDGFKKRFLWCLIESDIWTKIVLSLLSIAATTANNYKLSVLWIIHSLICSTQCKDNVERTRSLFFHFPTTDFSNPTPVWLQDPPSVWHTSLTAS